MLHQEIFQKNYNDELLLVSFINNSICVLTDNSESPLKIPFSLLEFSRLSYLS